MDRVNNCLADENRKNLLINSLRQRSKLNTETGCVEWTAHTNSFGYGMVSCGRSFTNMRAHRVSWSLENGELPEDMCICHTCDNPKCINPKHLFLGTKEDNSKDMVSKKRHFTPFRDFSGENHPLVTSPELAARGSANGNSKFTEDFVKELRAFEGNHLEAAKHFNISHSTAWAIRTYKTWKHVD